MAVSQCFLFLQQMKVTYSDQSRAEKGHIIFIAFVVQTGSQPSFTSSKEKSKGEKIRENQFLFPQSSMTDDDEDGGGRDDDEDDEDTLTKVK